MTEVAIGEALGWKFDHEPGITTRNNIITRWPDTLGPEPMGADLDAIIAEYEEYLATTQYKQNRMSGGPDGTELRYATLADQFDMQYWDKLNGTTVWIDHIAAVKAAHPKP